MQKAQLAAALVAALGLGFHGAAFAADTASAKTDKNVTIAKADKTDKAAAESSCKGKDGSCKTKETKTTSTTKKHSGKKETKKTTETKTDAAPAK